MKLAGTELANHVSLQCLILLIQKSVTCSPAMPLPVSHTSKFQTSRQSAVSSVGLLKAKYTSTPDALGLHWSGSGWLELLPH